jgi:tartrate dehydratase alpha subunit/fumarate hydratase class I-like protein
MPSSGIEGASVDENDAGSPDVKGGGLMGVREIPVDEIKQVVRRLCIEANTVLGDDVVTALETSLAIEESPVGQDVFRQLIRVALAAKGFGSEKMSQVALFPPSHGFTLEMKGGCAPAIR